MDTLEEIEHDIGRLHEVEGVGSKRIEIIQKGWAEQKQIKEVMMFLSMHGVSTALAVKFTNNTATASSTSSRTSRTVSRAIFTASDF